MNIGNTVIANSKYYLLASKRLLLYECQMQALKSLAAKLPKGEEVGKDLETFRLKMIFR